MKSRDQLLLEQAYCNVRTRDVDNVLQSLIAEDVKLIDQLIEEGFGDYLKKVGGAIKGGVQKAAAKIKETLTAGLASTLVKTIISAVPKEELENMVNIVAKGQVPKDKAEQVKGLLAQADGGQQVQQENYQERKAWLASLIFTESNIELALQNSGLLTEARSGRELQKFAKDVANKINELYPKNKKAMAAAIPKFTDTVSKYLGLPPQSSSSAPQEPPTQEQGSQTQQDSSQSSSPEQPQEQPQANSQQPSSGGVMDQAKGAINKAVSAVEEKIPTGKGLVNKVMGFVKAHPKISAAAGAALLGIVVAAFAGSAPVVAPALIAAVKGAGIAGTTSIVKQMISGEKVDLKQAGKAAAIGGALGGVGGVIAAGLGNIASAVMGTGGGGSAVSSNSNAAEASADHGKVVDEYTRKGNPSHGESPNADYKVTKYADGTESTSIQQEFDSKEYHDALKQDKADREMVRREMRKGTFN
jgi:hypothetical protein